LARRLFDCREALSARDIDHEIECAQSTPRSSEEVQTTRAVSLGLASSDLAALCDIDAVMQRNRQPSSCIAPQDLEQHLAGCVY